MMIRRLYIHYIPALSQRYGSSLRSALVVVRRQALPSLVAPLRESYQSDLGQVRRSRPIVRYYYARATTFIQLEPNLEPRVPRIR